jgi:hypothetical protein
MVLLFVLTLTLVSSQLFGPRLYAGATAGSSSFVGQLTGEGNVGDLIEVAGRLSGSRTENDLVFVVNVNALSVYNVSSKSSVMSFALTSLPSCVSISVGRVNAAGFLACQDSVWRVVFRQGLAPVQLTDSSFKCTPFPLCNMVSDRFPVPEIVLGCAENLDGNVALPGSLVRVDAGTGVAIMKPNTIGLLHIEWFVNFFFVRIFF